MDEEGRTRAARAVTDEMAARGWNAADLARAARIPDPATVREFAAGERWARTGTRGKIEAAFGWSPGHLERVARDNAGAAETDPVVVAIERSALSRSAKHGLLQHYFSLIEDGPSASAG